LNKASAKLYTIETSSLRVAGLLHCSPSRKEKLQKLGYLA